ncbi:MAG: hypothetical protein WC869_08030 [Phycisphaerae bacterium]|jgi:pimeloyl-ACP methyl ester carboxylesterase
MALGLYRALGCAGLVVLLAGCQSRQMVLNSQHMDSGLVIVLPGIDGQASYNEEACQVLCDQRLGMAVELYDWTVPLGGILNQCAVHRNRAVAGRLAARIVKYRRENPEGRVFLIGHSGGTAIAVWAAEALPPDQKVDGIVLLASSLSADYDLSGALRHSVSGIVNFSSEEDVGLLGAGTLLIGTMDGRHAEGAGRSGFHPQAGYWSEGGGRLVEVPWQPAMAAQGHDGGHFGCMSPRFVRARIVPLMAEDSAPRSIEPQWAWEASGPETPVDATLAMSDE